ncbi:hypothetical protein AB0I60_04790 [Actinosynnema sp. NPDC050436]|uniref:hypothetical protein n=1 Tax=Actinosynnema sp. NPDC050436 TaxID=3155659 RepID=UPI0033FF1CAC
MAALETEVDPDAVVDREGVEVVGTEYSAPEIDERWRGLTVWPDFAALFSERGCGGEDCKRCAAAMLTLQTRTSSCAGSSPGRSAKGWEGG